MFRAKCKNFENFERAFQNFELVNYIDTIIVSFDNNKPAVNIKLKQTSLIDSRIDQAKLEKNMLNKVSLYNIEVMNNKISTMPDNEPLKGFICFIIRFILD